MMVTLTLLDTECKQMRIMKLLGKNVTLACETKGKKLLQFKKHKLLF